MADIAISTCRTALIRKVQKTSVWWATGLAEKSGIVAKAACVARRLPVLFGGFAQVLGYDVTGVISGTAKVGETGVPYARVTLFNRSTCLPVAVARCDASGAFSFDTLYKTTSDYFAVAFDPEGGLDYNAVIFDKITPA